MLLKLRKLFNCNSKITNLDTKELEDKEELNLTHELLTTSLNELTETYNRDDTVLNDIVLKFNIIPSTLISSSILSIYVRSFIMESLLLRWFYLIGLIGFFASLISLFIYITLNTHMLKNKINKSKIICDNISTQYDKENLTKANAQIDSNNQLHKFIEFFNVAKSISLFVNLVFFSLFITIGAFNMTDKTNPLNQNNSEVKPLNESLTKYTPKPAQPKPSKEQTSKEKNNAKQH